MLPCPDLSCPCSASVCSDAGGILVGSLVFVFFLLLTVTSFHFIHTLTLTLTLTLILQVPVLPNRLKTDRFHKVMRLTKKITNEQSSNTPRLVHIWQVISRHWLVFYPYRHQFISLMLQSVNRLGLHAVGNASPVEYRHVAYGIAKTVIQWEQHRQKCLEHIRQEALVAAADAVTNANSHSNGNSSKIYNSISIY